MVVNFKDPLQPPTFTYAGKRYGRNTRNSHLPDPICYNNGGQNACETQFDCGKEVNIGDFEGGGPWRKAMICTEETTLELNGTRVVRDGFEDYEGVLRDCSTGLQL